MPTIAMLWSVMGCSTFGAEGALSSDSQECLECALRRNPEATTLPAAARQFTTACDGGDLSSCSVLGVMYENGRGVARDLQRAAGLFGLACRGGNPAACVNLGLLLERDDTGKRDPAGAALLFETACRDDHGEGCRHLGRVRYQAGDPAGAREALERGCEQEHAHCCQGLGVMYQHGHGVAQRPERARALLRRACKLGLLDACGRLDRLRRSSATAPTEDGTTESL